MELEWNCTAFIMKATFVDFFLCARMLLLLLLWLQVYV